MNFCVGCQMKGDFEYVVCETIENHRVRISRLTIFSARIPMTITRTLNRPIFCHFRSSYTCTLYTDCVYHFLMKNPQLIID